MWWGLIFGLTVETFRYVWWVLLRNVRNDFNPGLPFGAFDGLIPLPNKY